MKKKIHFSVVILSIVHPNCNGTQLFIIENYDKLIPQLIGHIFYFFRSVPHRNQYSDGDQGRGDSQLSGAV